MTTNTTTPPEAVIPPDDARRKLTMANPEDPNMRHISVAGGTYTILVTGEQTGGRYSLIDMLVPPGGGPPLHRHDFEEMFTILEGEIELTFRGEAQRSRYAFSACARQRGRRSSSWRSATRLVAVPRRHLS